MTTSRTRTAGPARLASPAGPMGPAGPAGPMGPAGPTKHLYLDQPYLSSHTATVLEVHEPGAAAVAPAQRERGAALVAILDVSAFYPGGGGQPCDLGRISGLPVLTVHEDPASPGTVLHFLGAGTATAGRAESAAAGVEGGAPGPGNGTVGAEGGAPAVPKPGDVVRCEIDWARRYDLMQHHTGQHLISALAHARYAAPTTGFHLGEDSATVDLAFPADETGTAGALQATLDELERLVAAEVFANRPVRLHLVEPGRPPEDAGPGLQLRVRGDGPAPKATDRWRVVEIAGLDLSPCGGTHVAATGEIGPVSFERWERIRDRVRLEFLCGWRALEAGRRRARDIKRLGRELSVHEREAVDHALRGLADADAAHRRAAELASAILNYEAEDLARTAEVLPGGGKLVARVLAAERPPADLKLLAALVSARPGHLALLASGGATPRLVFARAADVELDLRPVFAAAAARLGGRGGGTPALVQGGGGGGGDPAALERAIAEAVRLVREREVPRRPV